MLDAQDNTERLAAETWLNRFNEAVGSANEAVAELFVEDCHWRDLVALTGELRTTSGGKMANELVTAMAEAGASDFELHPTRLPPCTVTRAGREVIEAVFTFQTPKGDCTGLLRLLADLPEQAWTIMTSMECLNDAGTREEEAYAKDVRAPNWHDQREASRAFENRDPAVLVVGGGHAGLTIAARLRALNIDTLVVDREKRIGDNWRLRYHNLKLHNQIAVNEMPYLPFPKTWPRYIPKDMIANWLEFYTEALEINFWTEANFDGADWDEETRTWKARVTRHGETREMTVSHIVMAASTSAVPKYPDIPTLEQFQGEKIHAAHFEAGDKWHDRPVMVLGTGTSSHDISQHLHAHGAHVTMVQRSPTMVVNVEPSAQIYDGLYLGDFESIDDQDLINTSFPLDLIKQSHKIVTDQVKEIDRETLEGLERAGFRLEYGENGTGWPMKYRTRGGGYYFNIGCSELIIDGEIDLIQYHDIDEFVADGVRMKDGAHRPSDLVVMATGYETQGFLVEQLFGAEVRDRAGQVWGFNDHQEMANMWTRTGQPGLWFTAGAFSQCRIYGRFLAQQIALDLWA
ncbi:MAG: NAD(P)/FAD-dependent oxidoreductase [Pseudomonadota bacterium]